MDQPRPRDQDREPLDDAELAQDAELLPDREAMSLIAPGATSSTAAAAMLPDEPMEWHGPPDQMHTM